MSDKKGTMTDRERVEALLRRERPDRVPIWPFALGFTTVYAGITVADAYNNPKMSYEAHKKTCRDLGWLFMPMIGYASFGGWEFGGEMRWPSGRFAQSPMVTSRSVQTVEDALNLKMPDVKDAGIVPLQMEFSKLVVQERLDNEPFRLVPHIEGTFNVACNIAGVEMITRWMIKKPEAAHRLLRAATDFLVELAQYWKDNFGTEGVALFGGEPGAANQIISPKQFKEFALPYIKETHERILAMGYKTFLMHICGEQNANLPYWAEIPMGDPGLVTFGHEVPLARAAEYFPNDIIVGNLEPALIQTSTPEEVYELAKKNVQEGMKLSQGYIFAPGCELPPMAPVENVKAMTRAVNDFGWYI
jgi:uroporphyrinogen decarboxylase